MFNFGMGIVLMVNPMSKRDIRTIKRRARRVINTVGDAADGLCCKIR